MYVYTTKHFSRQQIQNVYQTLKGIKNLRLDEVGFHLQIFCFTFKETQILKFSLSLASSFLFQLIG